MDKIRRLISDRIRDRGLTLKEVSLKLGRSHSYMQQYIERGVPSKLNETVRHNLAEILDLPESEIGGMVRVDSLGAKSGDIANLEIHGGMGNGGLLSVETRDGDHRVSDEFINGSWSFPDPVKAVWQNMPDTYALPVIGDSMEPTIKGGSYAFVDLSYRYPAPSDIYAIDYGDGLMVKRIKLIPQSDKALVISDNETYGTDEVRRDDLHVYGRVVAWFHWKG